MFRTTFWPAAPARFFLRAVAARSALVKLRALAEGRQRSGRFLFLLVPHGPLIDPSVPMRTQRCRSQLLSCPISSCPCVCRLWLSWRSSGLCKILKRRDYCMRTVCDQKYALPNVNLPHKFYRRLGLFSPCFATPITCFCLRAGVVTVVTRTKVLTPPRLIFTNAHGAVAKGHFLHLVTVFHINARLFATASRQAKRLVERDLTPLIHGHQFFQSTRNEISQPRDAPTKINTAPAPRQRFSCAPFISTSLVSRATSFCSCSTWASKRPRSYSRSVILAAPSLRLPETAVAKRLGVQKTAI